MIVTFCGHADFIPSGEYERRIFDFLEETVGNQVAEMYLGGYGKFDDFAYHCCKKYKDKHPNTTLVFVTPYRSNTYLQNYLASQGKKFDFILYPEIENKLKKYAIIYRNQYMIEKADFVVAYVTHAHGGAYKAYAYALKKEKKVLNLSYFKIPRPISTG